eukprot:COSAG06_NODE_37935_length_429_cov_0.939394_1_plen_44_part_10
MGEEPDTGRGQSKVASALQAHSEPRLALSPLRNSRTAGGIFFPR